MLLRIAELIVVAAAESVLAMVVTFAMSPFIKLALDWDAGERIVLPLDLVSIGRIILAGAIIVYMIKLPFEGTKK